MKSILSLLLFFPILAFAQNTLVIFPYTEEGESICDNYNVYNTKMVLQTIEEACIYNAFNVIDTQTRMRKIEAENVCHLRNNQIRKAVMGQRQKSYIEVSYKLHKTPKGNYLDLYLLLRDANSSNVFVVQKMTSKKRYSSNIKEFAQRLIQLNFDDFKQQCNLARKNGTKVDISSMKIPSIAPTQKTDYTKGKQPKPLKGSKGAKEKEVVAAPVVEKFPLSDVDQNIPTYGKVNENAVAVVIGNRTYRNNDVPEVKFAINDAKMVKSYLKYGFGFKEENIIYIEDASQADFNAIFGIKGNAKGKLYNYVKPNVSDVFVYYSGHGAPNPETNKGYFVPVDTDPSLIHFNGYSLDTFYENLGLVPYKSLTIVVDACFSGSSEGGMLLKNISPVFIKSENKVLRDENVVILTSAASEQVSSWYNEKYHSLFTYYYLKGLQGAADTNKDRKVTLGEMKAYIVDNVPYMARRLNNREQTPEITGSDEIILIQR
ncbi:caspase family protein [Flammeovirga sp. EKP202]|uniref:caspase family protein n=1 Tax=Flammeovirga sp. EKP202 TaxID=2770592 RepID=UPI00165EF461|nr:caspase family protein [Flammeovirga sp. EKP202]MBD0401024.1 caspase family protein [Flammeovirga sp. EKP202]